jgi:hypothetical protein
MSGEIIPFAEDRPRRDADETVRCAKCGKAVAATALRCPYCCFSFSGVASSTQHVPLRSVRLGTRRFWIIVLAAGVLLLAVVGLVLKLT